MRIVGGGHDYYDNGLFDPAIVLTRYKDKTIPMEEFHKLGIEFGMHGLDLVRSISDNSRDWRRKHSFEYEADVVKVVFGPRIYTAIRIRHSLGSIQMSHEQKAEPPEGWIFWDAEKLAAWLAAKELILKRSGLWRKEVPQIGVEETTGALREYMIANKYSILVPRIRRYDVPKQVGVNPHNLKSLEFAKALDPWQAHQELSMWIGGVLGGSSPEIARITDDKVLIQNHGYDKQSFRGPRL